MRFGGQMTTGLPLRNPVVDQVASDTSEVSAYIKDNNMKKIGIIGGGQLGRMLIQAAIDWSLEIHVLDPDKDAPCKAIAHRFVVGHRTDAEAVYQFGKDLDIVTIEIENVSVEGLKRLEENGVQVFPQPAVIEIIKDKRLQKQFYHQHQIPTADFVLVENRAAIEQHLDFLPAFQKLGTGGYDGKGVKKLATPDEVEWAFDAPSLLEKLVDIDKELSVIVARNQQGIVVAFPLVELVFNPVYNLVDYLLSPASVSDIINKKATEIAKDIITKLDMVGLLAIELFLTKTGELLVNEIAPRPHNSGHHTIEGNLTSQFQQHLRAILNFPLGATAVRQQAAMLNILGAEGHRGEATYQHFEEVINMEAVYVHLYGKKLTKPGRKMGHLTILDNDTSSLMEKIQLLKNKIKVVSDDLDMTI